MSVNLKKGGGVNLSKQSSSSLKKIIVGLGWDEVKHKKGLLGLFKKEPEFDCDATAILCDIDGKLISRKALAEPNKLDKDVVYFGNLRHYSGCVTHTGDNRTGEGEGDDEQIIVDLATLPPEYTSIVFVVNIYEAVERKQHFGMIENAYIRIVDDDTKKELCRYNLTEDYAGHTALIFGEIKYTSDGWEFRAIGDGTKDVGVLQTVTRFV